MEKIALLLVLALSILHFPFSGLEAQTWKEMMDSTKFYQGKQDYQTALLWAEKAESKAKAQFGEMDTNYIASIVSIYSCYFYMGNYEKAIEYCEKAKQIINEVRGEKSQDYVEICNNLGTFYNFNRNYEKAERYFKESLAIYRSFNKGDNTDLARIINNFAEFYYNIGDIKLAEPLFKEALEMRRKLFKGDNADLAQSINDFAVFSFSYATDDNKQVELLLKEALEMRRRLFKGDNPDIAESMSNLAGFYTEIGYYSQAEPLHREALEIRRRLFKGDNPDLAQSINGLAIFYYTRGDYKQAEPLFREALAMRRRMFKSDHPELAQSISNFATFCHQAIGDYKQAESLYKESLEMRRRIFKGDYTALALSINNIAVFYKDIGNFEQAEHLFQEALEMRRRLGDKREIASSLNLLAELYRVKGDYKQAEPLYKEALENYRSIFKVDHPDLALSINFLAYFYLEIGDIKQAEPLLKEALEIRRRLFKGDNRDLAQSINNLAAFYYSIGNYKQAEPLFKEAIDISKNIVNNYFPSLSEKEKKLFWNTVSNNFEAFNSFAIKENLENPSILCNMYDLELFIKALLFNSTSKIKRRIINSNDTALINKFRELSDKKEFLVKLYSMTEDSRKKKGFDVDSIEKITNEIEKELSLKSELYAQSFEKKKVTWNSIQTQLKEGEAAIEVVRFRLKDKNRYTDTIYYTFLILNNKTQEHPEIIILENGKKLENEYYNDYKKNTKDRKKDKLSFGRYWAKLYVKLKGFKKVYFSADGVYNKLNPSTLLMPNGKYLLDIQDIQQVNSTKDLLLGYKNTEKVNNSYTSAVLIGNPNFSLSESKVREVSWKMRNLDYNENNYETFESTRGIKLTRLPGTEKEIKKIEKLLEEKQIKVQTYLGDLALKTAVITANNPSILHIATHGLFLEDVKREGSNLLGFEEKKMVENPLLRSGLFFTGVENYIRSDSIKPTGAENGLLTAYEAMNLDLDKTELVVLSACETGLGEIVNGEGVYGLRRAFQQAGAKTVVMSLWKVNDEATQELMSSFYKNWVTGMTKREAFSKAQQEIKAKYKDPYFWGAFVMVGE